MKIRSLPTLAAPLILAGPASAGFVGLTMVAKPNPYALTVNVYAQFDEREGDFVFAVAGTPLSPLSVNVRNGTFFQVAACGVDTAPPSNLFELFPSLEYDTFVTIGAKTAEGDATTVAAGWPGFGPDRLAFDDTGWFVTPNDPQGEPDENNRVLLMQLSTTEGIGFFGTILVAGFSNGSDFQAYVSFDSQPAPGTAALAGMALAFGRRRRRRGLPGS